VQLIRRRLLHYRIALTLIAVLLLFILVTLPFTVASVVDDLLGRSSGHAFRLAWGPPAMEAPTHSRLQVGIVELDPYKLQATLRVSGHHVCQVPCPWNERVVFFALPLHEPQPEGLPPSASVTLPPEQVEVTQSIQLPVYGNPARYPYDEYELVLGVVLQHVYPDGTVQTLSPAEAMGHLFLTLQEQLPRHSMDPPVVVDAADLQRSAPALPYGYLTLQRVTITRPLYTKVLAVLLVLLITVAAAYAVFMRPLSELVVNAGALVLGVWGIRGILVSQNYPGLTAVDLALSVVIIFLLGAITVRAFAFLYERAQLPGRPARLRGLLGRSTPAVESDGPRDGAARAGREEREGITRP